jgi:hypothetical protein
MMAVDPNRFSRVLPDPELEQEARAIAYNVGADIRTVRREMLEPGTTQGLTGKAIRAALSGAMPVRPPTAAPPQPIISLHELAARLSRLEVEVQRLKGER